MVTTATSRVGHLARQPKLQIMAVLVLLAAVAIVRQPELGDRAVAQLVLGLVAAVLAEFAFFGKVSGSGVQSAAVTGLLVGALLAPSAGLTVVWMAATAAIASKKLLEHAPGRHIFNPAAFGLLLSVILFGNRVNWWGYSSPYIVVVAAGMVLFRLRRLSLPFCYIATRALSAVAFGRAVPGLEAVLVGNLFFAFIMVVEPRTSPAKRRAQWLFGGLVGFLAMCFYEFVPFLEGDLAALLAANSVKPWLERLTDHGRK